MLIVNKKNKSMTNLDILKLPIVTQILINDYLVPLNPNTPVEIHLLNINVIISQILCFNRIKIYNDEFEIDTFPNIYSIVFADSGVGKDKSKQTLATLTESFTERKKYLEHQYYEKRLKEIEQEIEEKGIKGAQATAYRKEHHPRRLAFKITSATAEGFVADREQMDNAHFGSIHWYCGEFLDYIKGTDGNKEYFMSLIKEVYDNGNSEAKSIKSNKNVVPVYGVPQTMSVHSVIDTDSSSDNLGYIFERGYARRCLVACPKSKPYIKVDLKEKREKRRMAIQSKEKLSKFFSDLVDRTRNIKFVDDYIFHDPKTFTLTEDAVIRYDEYHEENQKLAMEKRNSDNAHITSDIAGRSWKMIKLAAIMAVQNRNEFTIDVDDIEMAIYQVNFFSEQLVRFYRAEQIIDAERLYDYIIENQDKGPITKTVIRKQKFVPNNQEATRWIADNLAQVKELAEERGKIFSEDVHGSNVGRRYSIIDKPKNDEAMKILTYIRENGDVTCLTLQHLTKQFGPGVGIVLVEHKAKQRPDGGYYL